MTAYPKTAPTRDKEYRRWVSTLPCALCGLEGRSQAAHGPSLGKSIKADDDTCIPLCADGPGKLGCHTLVDQYRMFDREARVELLAALAKETRALWAQRGKP